MASIYDIAVRMTMTNQVSPVLQTIAHDLLGIHRHTMNAAGGFNTIRNAIVGLGAAWAGTKIIEGVSKIVDHGGKLLNIQNQMKTGSWSPEEIDHGYQRARELSQKYKALAPREILEIMKEIAPALGSKDDAMAKAEPMVQMLMALKLRLGDEKGSALHKQVIASVRAAELTGNAMTKERFVQYLDMQTKIINAFNGLIKPEDMALMAKYGRSSAMRWSDRFIGSVLPTIGQELGGSSTGVAIMSMNQAVAGGMMTEKSRNWFNDMGLVDQAKARRLGALSPEGRLRRNMPGLIIGADQAQTDPDLWMKNTVIPAMIKKGKITQAHIDAIAKGDLKDGLGLEGMSKIQNELYIAFGNRTAQGLANIYALQVRKIERDQKILQDSFGLSKTVEVWERDYNMQKGAFHAQLDAIGDALSLPMLPSAIEGLKSLNGILAGIAKFFGDNPVFARMAVSAAMAGGLVLLAAGVGALIAIFAGPIALATAGVVALTAAVGTLVAIKWDKVKTWAQDIAQKIAEGFADVKAKIKVKPEQGWLDYIFKDMVGDIASGARRLFFAVPQLLTEAVTAVAKDVDHWFRKIPNMLTETVSAVFGELGNMIKNALLSLLPNLKKIFGLDGSWKGGPLKPGEVSPVPGSPGPNSNPGFEPGSGVPSFQLQRYVPGMDKNGMIQTRTVINLDSRTIADVVAMQIARMAEHATGGMGFDRQMQPLLPDNSIAT